MSWTSLHVFCDRNGGTIDRLVIDGVQPIVERAVEDTRLAGWFFLRDPERGSHLKLGLQPRAPDAVDTIRDALAVWLRHVAPDATLTEAPYQAEADRYGGPAGLPISERLFLESSRVAVAAMRHAPDRRRRLVAAVRLLLAMIDGMQLAPLAAIGWLRAPRTDDDTVDPTQAANASFLAEQEFFAHEEVWLRQRPGETPDDEAGPPSLARYWHQEVGLAVRDYRALAAPLSAPIDVIMRRQLRLLHNRLGLTAVDEHYVTWLASLVLARTRPHVRFADDGIDALDRVYHEQSKFTWAVFARDQEPGPVAPAALAAAAGAAEPRAGTAPALRLAALDPAAAGPAAAALAAVLRDRKSGRTGYDGALGVDRLGLVLGLAAGQAAPMPITVGGARYELRRLTYPSAGARYPIRLTVLARNVDGLAPGLYAYHEGDHALHPLGPAPDRAALLRAVPSLAGSPDDPMAVQAADAPALLFPVADLSRQRERYGLRAYRLVNLECGHQAQNVCLVATALGLACITIASFFDDLLGQLLGVDGVNRAPLYVIPLGPGPA